MADTPGATTGYDLPYEALLHPAPLLRAGQVVLLRVETREPVSPEAVRSLDALVTAFFMLASTGALAGSTLEPWSSSIADRGPAVVVAGGVEWELKDCRLDEKAAAILFQLFLLSHEAHPLQRVSLSRAGDTRPLQALPKTTRRAGTAYPGHWRKLPFELELEENPEEELEVRLVFRRPLSEEQVATVEDRLLTWAAAAAMGAYGVAPVPPDQCSLSPAMSVEVYEEELTWGLSDFQAHTSALDGLVNVLAALDHEGAALAEVSIV